MFNLLGLGYFEAARSGEHARVVTRPNVRRVPLSDCRITFDSHAALISTVVVWGGTRTIGEPVNRPSQKPITMASATE